MHYSAKLVPENGTVGAAASRRPSGGDGLLRTLLSLTRRIDRVMRELYDNDDSYRLRLKVDKNVLSKDKRAARLIMERATPPTSSTVVTGRSSENLAYYG